MTAAWTEICCDVPADLVDEVSTFLVELTGNGVTVDNLVLDTFTLEEPDDSGLKTIKAYIAASGPLDDTLSAISAYLADAGSRHGTPLAPPRAARIDEEDWANNWKVHFRPTRIGRHFIIKPTWEEVHPAPGDIILELDPGMAFGTGTHATTRLCLEALEQIAGHEGPYAAYTYPTVERILDVGTGTGILAIGAVKLGIGEAVAIDIDPEAVAIARINCELNRIDQPVMVGTTPLTEIDGRFGIVVANILAEELARLAPDLTTRIAPRGFLILSGILNEKEELVTEAFLRSGLTPVATTREAEWSCLVFFRPSP